MLNISGLSSDNKVILDFLIQNEDDEILFFDKFWKNEKEQCFSIYDFRLYKLSQNNITFEYFEELFNNDQLHALETLFQHPVKKKEVDYLKKKIANDEMSLKTFFQLHTENPQYKLMRLLL